MLGGKLAGGVAVMGMEKSFAERSRSWAMYLSLSMGGSGVVSRMWREGGFWPVRRGSRRTFDVYRGRVSTGLHDATEEDGDVAFVLFSQMTVFEDDCCWYWHTQHRIA